MKILSLKIGDNVIVAPSGIPTGGMEAGGTGEKIIQIGVTILILGGIILALGSLILSGIQWINSGGDKQALQNARNRLIFSVIGLVIIFLAILVVALIGNFFGVSLLRIPGSPDQPT